jgi:Major Facilitator Superfamily
MSTQETAGGRIIETRIPARLDLREQETVGFLTIAKTVFGAYPRRTAVGLSLFIGQAFLYNAVFFTYALVLGTFYDVKPAAVGYYIIPFAIGNFVGPLVLGRLFDSVGRKPMIAGTYIVPGVLLVVTAFLFKAGTWTAETQTAARCVIFFFASAGASSAYLTVSEIFPMETRALAIAFFYAVGTAAGGITGPLLFGKLVESEDPGQVFWGYILGAALMIAAGIVQALIGVEAAGKDLEQIAKPLSAEAADGEDTPAGARDGARGERRPARELEPRFERPRRPERGRRFGPSEARFSYSPVQQSSSRVPNEDVDEEDRAPSSPRCSRPAPRASTAARSGNGCCAATGGPGATAMRSRSPRAAGWSFRRRGGATSPRRMRGRRADAGRARERGASQRRSDQCPSAGRT